MRKNPYKASEINKSPRLRRLAEQRLFPMTELHMGRWHYCAFLMVRDLYRLKDKRIQKIFDKYHCVMLKESIGLLFPPSLKPKQIPEHLRLLKSTGEKVALEADRGQNGNYN